MASQSSAKHCFSSSGIFILTSILERNVSSLSTKDESVRGLLDTVVVIAALDAGGADVTDDVVPCAGVLLVTTATFVADLSEELVDVPLFFLAAGSSLSSFTDSSFPVASFLDSTVTGVAFCLDLFPRPEGAVAAFVVGLFTSFEGVDALDSLPPLLVAPLSLEAVVTVSPFFPFGVSEI